MSFLGSLDPVAAAPGSDTAIDDRIDAFAKAREMAEAAMSSAYHQLLREREENDRLRRQLIEAKLEIFTREEFAAKLKISVDKLDELVAAKKISYVRLSARLKRFTSVHLVEAARVLEVKAEVQKSKVQRWRNAA